jgi:hypothetical protein
MVKRETEREREGRERAFKHSQNASICVVKFSGQSLSRSNSGIK